MLGPNGAGKSAVLAGLNIFFRNSASSVTNVTTLIDEDFHQKNTRKPIQITLTFSDLPPSAQEDFKAYYRQGKLVVFARSEWNEAGQNAPVHQYGSRMVMEAFAPFFDAYDRGAKSEDLKSIYKDMKRRYGDLGDVTTKEKMRDALRSYEEAHPELCSLTDSSNQFYGWTSGSNLLRKYVQWVFVPAVKEASTEQQEGSKTALGQLLERTIRNEVDFEGPLEELKNSFAEKYKEVIQKEQSKLETIEQRLKDRLRQWTTTNSMLLLQWDYDPGKSVSVSQPVARLRIGEDKFIGDVARLGHGMQRALIVTLLQELASIEQEHAPKLLLGFEEPELYQHPPQAQHIAAVLEQLATQVKHNTQVLVTTHSPYFVSSKGFESVRMLRKDDADRFTVVRQATYRNICDRVKCALGEDPQLASPESLMAQVEQIMQPSQRELFFSPLPILVEGIEDVAFLSTYLHLSGQWETFRRIGCHFVIAEGKNALSRPLAIALALGIPCFVVIDSDAHETDPGKRNGNLRDNSCILNLCGLQGANPLPDQTLMDKNVVMWATEIDREVLKDIGEREWEEAESNVRKKQNLVEGVKRKNSILVTATLQELWNGSKKSECLLNACSYILSYAQEVRGLIFESPGT